MKNSIKDIVVKKIDMNEMAEFQKRMDREVKANKESERIKNVLNFEKIEFVKKSSICLIAYENFDYTLVNYVDKFIHNKNIPGISNINIPIKQILLTATEGLMHFHNKGFVHRNIDYENIVIVDEDGCSTGKIADLSMSKKLVDDKASISRDLSKNICSAPELIEFYKRNKTNKRKSTGENLGKKISKEIDVFSLGIVYFYALTGDHLFDREGSDVDKNICNSKFKPRLDSLQCSNVIKPWEVPLATSLIRCMVQRDPKMRPTIKYILNHPFFWSDQHKELFLFTSSQYIQGCGEKNSKNEDSKENEKISYDSNYVNTCQGKELMNIKYGTNYAKWYSNLENDDSIPEKIKRGIRNNDPTELLRSLRNIVSIHCKFLTHFCLLCL